MASLSLRQFLEYIRAFNAKDYQKQHSFYHPDVRLVIPDPEVGTQVGSAGIMNHYAVLHATAEETVVPILVMIDQGHIFFVMETYFRYVQATDRRCDQSHRVGTVRHGRWKDEAYNLQRVQP
ncbi:hypothetical protein BP00DRAFT_132266 [Aspergillus indologenus CBS 114.80]|uniref:SnoaL-like domain-containing protein n=1 Tax=Aspergillus indologenus CBS 114.80 TaxID=1450541 RepID=A0A2V5IWN4_9EURO|nr:hypothetical protein BP00DRAFT_132266 [Aspergillus indologenus CBS 114.80]